MTSTHNKSDVVAFCHQLKLRAPDGKNYNTAHYNLQAIVSVGFKEDRGQPGVC